MIPDRFPDSIASPYLMSDEECAALLPAAGTDATLWEVFSRWLIRHRLRNPDDAREDIELVNEFADAIAPLVSHAEILL